MNVIINHEFTRESRLTSIAIMFTRESRFKDASPKEKLEIINEFN